MGGSGRYMPGPARQVSRVSSYSSSTPGYGYSDGGPGSGRFMPELSSRSCTVPIEPATASGYAVRLRSESPGPRITWTSSTVAGVTGPQGDAATLVASPIAIAPRSMLQAPSSPRLQPKAQVQHTQLWRQIGPSSASVVASAPALPVSVASSAPTLATPRSVTRGVLPAASMGERSSTPTLATRGLLPAASMGVAMVGSAAATTP